MESTLTAIESNGTVDENCQLHLDRMLPITGPIRVRVIVLYPVEEELDESLWLHAAACNPAFTFLNDPEEDVYSSTDGKPYNDEV